MRVIHPGYGWRPNTRIHKRLMNMSPKEREEYELKLKKKDEKRYKNFKHWQEIYMEVLPKYKINY